MSDTPKIHFNLDTFEYEDEKKVDPFTVVIGGKPRKFAHPASVDYRLVAASDEALRRGDFQPWLRSVLSKDDADEIVGKKKIPLAGIVELNQRWNKHYNQPDSGEGSASSTS